MVCGEERPLDPADSYHRSIVMVGNMLIPISSGVQQETSHTTSPHESHRRERAWKHESKEKIVNDSNLSAGCGDHVVSLFLNYQQLARQHSQHIQRHKSTLGGCITKGRQRSHWALFFACFIYLYSEIKIKGIRSEQEDDIVRKPQNGEIALPFIPC